MSNSRSSKEPFIKPTIASDEITLSLLENNKKDPATIERETGFAFFLTGRYQAAKKCYLNVLKEDIRDVNALFNLGNVYCYLGEPDKALICYDQCLAVISVLENTEMYAETKQNAGNNQRLTLRR